jgi:hypothetical protein
VTQEARVNVQAVLPAHAGDIDSGLDTPEFKHRVEHGKANFLLRH